MTLWDIDLYPIPSTPFRDGPLTGRTCTIPDGEQKGRSLYVGRLLGSGAFYLVSVDGCPPQWCRAESVASLFH